MFNNDGFLPNTTTRKLSHGQQHPPAPQGECLFILTRRSSSASSSSSGDRHRCPCPGFRVEQRAPGTRCECGHQAWCHEQESPAAASVPLHEHLKVVEKLQQLQEELDKEREERDNEVKGLYHAIQGVYSALAHVSAQNGTRLTALDDKIESTMDQNQRCQDRLDVTESRLIHIDEATMDLETRWDRLDPDSVSGKPSPPAPDVISLPAPLRTSTQKEKAMLDVSSSWSAEVIFTPSSSQSRPFPRSSIPFYRCRSRNLITTLEFEDQTRSCFISNVEHAFSHVLCGRAWIPLLCHTIPLGTASELILNPLPPGKDTSDMWDYAFLERYCIAGDNREAGALYIALRDDELTWDEIRSLPHAPTTDDSCWHFDASLDGIESGQADIDLDFLEAAPAPPPYSSKRPSRVMPPIAGSDTASVRSSTAPSLVPSSTSQSSRARSSSEHPAEHPAEELEEDRAAKKQKLPADTALDPPSIYISARSKRKLPIREMKSPTSTYSRFRPMQTLLNRHHAGKERSGPEESAEADNTGLTPEESRCKVPGVL